ncbi:MAG: hypothetical protein JRN67_03245 [Nitrososphaerota archaeon]|nr:hypothetical protein [Nitrososphaerota archaeon]
MIENWRSDLLSRGFKRIYLQASRHNDELDLYLKASRDVENIVKGDKKLLRELRAESQSLLRLKEKMKRGSRRVAEKQLETALSKTRSLLLKAYALKE